MVGVYVGSGWPLLRKGWMSLIGWSRWSAGVPGRNGAWAGWVVLTTKRLPLGASRLFAVRLPSFSGAPFASSRDTKFGAFCGSGWFHCGAAAAIRNWWFRNEPPKAAWKK